MCAMVVPLPSCKGLPPSSGGGGGLSEHGDPGLSPAPQGAACVQAARRGAKRPAGAATSGIRDRCRGGAPGVALAR